jgi:hypothetical protein
MGGVEIFLQLYDCSDNFLFYRFRRYDVVVKCLYLNLQTTTRNYVVIYQLNFIVMVPL